MSFEISERRAFRKIRKNKTPLSEICSYSYIWIYFMSLLFQIYTFFFKSLNLFHFKNVPFISNFIFNTVQNSKIQSYIYIIYYIVCIVSVNAHEYKFLHKKLFYINENEH